MADHYRQSLMFEACQQGRHAALHDSVNTKFVDHVSPDNPDLGKTEHVVSTYAGVQTIPDKQMAAVGAKRSSCIRVPYFGVALQCLPRTELVLTLTGGMRSVVRGNRELRLVKAPHELHPFHFLMAWHPRLNTEPGHVWLREAMRSTTGIASVKTG